MHVCSSVAVPMRGKLLNCLPGVRWTPSDIPSSAAADSAAAPGEKRQHRTYSLLSSASRRLKAAAPNHGPVYRRQSTISIEDVGGEVGKRTFRQGQSMFFARLPLEVRRMVYGYVMGEETVHLTMGAKTRFGHFVCGEEGEEGMKCRCKVLVGGRVGRRLGRECGALLRSCRRIYSEAVPHLYTQHTFSLLHLTHLLYLPSRLPVPRLNTIRTLRLRWAIRALPYLRRGPSKRLAYPDDTSNWARGWAILAGMQGLRDVYVVLVDPSHDQMWERNWNELEGFLLEPVKEVTRPWKFELLLPYASCGLAHDMGDSPVKLTKPDGEGEDEDEE